VAEYGRYLYAVSRKLPPEVLDDMVGLGDGVIQTVTVGDLSGIVSSVDLAEYGEEALRKNLERLDWLEGAARGHDAVVHAAAAVAPTAPMRLATIFLDDDGVKTRLEEQYDAIAAVLDRVEGHAEWSVKVMVEPAATPSAAEEEAPASGADYLRRRRAQQQARQEGIGDAHAVAERVHDALVAVAAASRRLAPQDPRLTGHTGTMVHNAAYLVAQDRSDDFTRAVTEQAQAHPDVVLDARGPWPPYSFAMLDQT
jgi:Gas vesicle synthesis protein GvpL/GvpF